MKTPSGMMTYHDIQLGDFQKDDIHIGKIMLDFDLTRNETFIYSYLAQHQKSGKCQLSINALCANAGKHKGKFIISKRTAKRGLKSLEKKGLIRILYITSIAIGQKLLPPNIQSPLPPPISPPIEIGIVYLAQADTQIKIGITRNLESRISELSTASPYDIEVVYSCQYKDYKEIERELHKIFADKQSHREWFELTCDDIDFIKAYRPEMKIGEVSNE